MKKREKVNESLNVIMLAVILIIISIFLFLIGELGNNKILFINSTLINIFFSIASVFALVASICEIVDSITIRKINRHFKIAFFCSITGLLLSISTLGLAFLPDNIKIVYEIIEIIALIFETAVFFFYIAGIKKIHTDDKNQKMAKFGGVLEAMYIIFTILFYLLTIVIAVFTGINPVVSLVLSICSFVFCLGAYLICFVFLYKSKKSISISKKRILN